MPGGIRQCAAWAERHDRPRYTLRERCPDCEGETRPAAPARFSPEDSYGAYRRALIRRQEE